MNSSKTERLGGGRERGSAISRQLPSEELDFSYVYVFIFSTVKNSSGFNKLKFEV